MSEFNNNKEDLIAFLSEDAVEIDLDFTKDEETDIVEEVDQTETVAVEEVVEEPAKEELPKAAEKPVVEKKASKSEKKTAVKVDNSNEKVAIFSTKNVTWSEVGKVYCGYNIVTKEAADRWLTRNHIRLATPQEVAKEFGL